MNCPAGSIYGKARAFTPLPDEPLEGPVYLRSSSNSLPDAVIALHGLVDINLVAGSTLSNARIRPFSRSSRANLQSSSSGPPAAAGNEGL